MKSNKKRALHIFRQDLRLSDNPSLNYISENYDEVLCVYFHNPNETKSWTTGAASNWFLHFTLKALEEDLLKRGGCLIYLRSSDEINQLIDNENIRGVYWNRRYEPFAIKNDAQLKLQLREKGLEVKSFNSQLLWEPWELQTQQGNPFQVFTPFWKKALTFGEPSRPQNFKKSLSFLKTKSNLQLSDLQLLPKIKWDRGFYDHWVPGESGAQIALKKFSPLGAHYQSQRDFPAIEGTSQLSPHLHFGSISVREIWNVLRNLQESTRSSKDKKEIDVYLKELGWREFAYHLLFHFSHTTDQPLREKFNQFPWVKNKKQLQAWQQGQTGYPIVDAGMRQLWHTGWMHNRVRMIVASFLVKDLRISWLEGARWFWDTLVDADLASNTMGWQWAGGCGADAAPYFRIFNPYLQGAKFDPDGDYVKKWVPELSKLPPQWIHQPHEAPPLILQSAGIQLGKTYPHPIVDHKTARDEALIALKSIS